MLMSKRNPDYEGSNWQKFAKWCNGDYDPAKGKFEIKKPTGKPKGQNIVGKLMHILSAEEDLYEAEQGRHLTTFGRIYVVISIALGVLLTILLLMTVAQLPRFGDAHAPENNEVAKRYIEKGLEETGAVNIVAGMILDYRAFDTFGESCVLFVASCCVLMLLKGKKPEESDTHYEPGRSAILRPAARILVPVIIIFGIYVILNGHISPGGGFSGGAIIGSGFILYITAFGFERAGQFLSEKFIKIITVCALSFYCFAKSYSFYTGANHLESVITPGTPGAILSAGLIVYLNICVGIVVACTMYSFYVTFRRGSF
jgi:multicomponent Na+:H+ antiporter subunit B